MKMLVRVLLLLLVWGGSCHAQIGGALPSPCETNGPYVTVLSTKACTASYLTGTKPAYDVVVYDGAGVKIGGTTTINFIDGAIDYASVLALQGPQQLGSPIARPITGNFQRQVFVTKWYSQNGGPDASVVVGDDPVTNYPVLRVFGTSVVVGFGNSALDNDSRRLVLPDSVALNTRAVTVLAVASQFTSYGTGLAPIFYTSRTGSNGIGISRPAGLSNDLAFPFTSNWRSVLLGISDDALVPAHTDQQAMTITSGSSGGELANDLGTATFGTVTSATGTGVTIGCLASTTSDGSCHHGDIALLAVKSAYSPPDVTASMRQIASQFFGLPLSLSIPNVVIDGDSGTYGYANFWPAVSGSNQGSEGYGSAQFLPAAMKKQIRTNNLARGGSVFPLGGSSVLGRAGRWRAAYRAEASINIGLVELGSNPPTGSDIGPYVDAAVAWAAAVRSTGQTWTLFVSNQGGGNPCSTADNVAYDVALRAAAASNNFTVVNNYSATTVGCLTALYGLANIWSPNPLGHVYSFGIHESFALDGLGKVNAAIP